MKHENGKIVADSGEGYHNKADLINELDKLGAAFAKTHVVDTTLTA